MKRISVLRCVVAAALPAALACGSGATSAVGAPVASVGGTSAAAAGSPTPSRPGAHDDAKAAAPADYPWLEDVDGARALDFARAHNAVSEGPLAATPGFASLEQKLFAIATAKDRIPRAHQQGKWLYDFWTDAEHPRGLLRRTTWAEYRKDAPAWETVLDITALGQQEHESWVFKGSPWVYPSYDRCLVHLSRGGGDAVVVREFDLTKKAFVADGFNLPEAKTNVSWKDRNTLYVGTDFGEGTMTPSGYPRTIREWSRGTPLATARTVFEARPTDVIAHGSHSDDHGKSRDVFSRAIDTVHAEVFLRQGTHLTKIDVPSDATINLWDDQLLVTLRSDWVVGTKTHPKGALLVTSLDGFLAGKRALEPLFTPRANASLKGVVGTKTRLVVTSLVDVRSEVTVFSREGGRWKGRRLETQTPADLSVVPVDEHTTDDTWLWQNDFLVPPSVSSWNVATNKRELLKQTPAYFDATSLEVTQHFATSKDGTKVPYFEVAKKDRKGPSPTILSAYGGFDISLTPGYNGGRGAVWLERGGVFVQGNLRGGGEYGPAWHDAARKHERQHAYDDFAAIAEDLVARNVTTAKQLGIFGGSNGGLLTSVALTQRPELFGAVVSLVPLTDMQRYHKLLAGASWMGEYGDPDNAEDWTALRKYSPFHNVKQAGEVTYPPMFYLSSTRDDRVHPGHARKMVARLEDYGHKPLYYENIEGGHAGAADARQAAHVTALWYTFLGRTLGLPLTGSSER